MDGAALHEAEKAFVAAGNRKEKLRALEGGLVPYALQNLSPPPAAEEAAAWKSTVTATLGLLKTIVAASDEVPEVAAYFGAQEVQVLIDFLRERTGDAEDAVASSACSLLEALLSVDGPQRLGSLALGSGGAEVAIGLLQKPACVTVRCAFRGAICSAKILFGPSLSLFICTHDALPLVALAGLCWH